MKTDCLAMVLVGGSGSRLHPITKQTAKPAVTFGGKYKLIDFVLSNLSNSNINTVGIITQYEPHALMNYIEHGATWDLDITDGGIQFLTPYTSSDGEHWQKGTAHAIRQHMRFIDQHQPNHVLILPGDHVYKMDYNEMLKNHKESDVDITLGVFEPRDSLSRYGVLKTDEKGYVAEFDEKPKEPKSTLASMGIYIFKTEALKRILKEELKEQFDFGKDIIPKALKEHYSIKAYTYQGYFRDVGTIKSLYEANMDLIHHPEYLKLFDEKHLPLYTKPTDFPPHHIRRKNAVKDALISDGCVVLGAITRSVLAPNIKVGLGALIKDSIIHENVVIGDHCTLKNVIVMPGTVIMKDTDIVFDEITVVNNEMLWALGADVDE